MIRTSCVFCQIADGRAPAKYVHTWVDAVAIVPLNPVTPGHTLVIPRKHVADATVDLETTAHMFEHAADAARRMGPVNLITSVGAEATQTVFHLHVHIVPRAHGDGLPLPWTPQQEAAAR